MWSFGVYVVVRRIRGTERSADYRHRWFGMDRFVSL